MLEAVVIGWFTFEFLLKLFICPNKIKYLTSVYTICDLISFVPYYIYLANPDVNGLRVLKDISRIFKLCSLMKYFEDWDTLNTIMRTIKQSFKEILVFLVYLIIVLLFFSTLVFYMEYQTEDRSVNLRHFNIIKFNSFILFLASLSLYQPLFGN